MSINPQDLLSASGPFQFPSSKPTGPVDPGQAAVAASQQQDDTIPQATLDAINKGMARLNSADSSGGGSGSTGGSGGGGTPSTPSTPSSPSSLLQTALQQIQALSAAGTTALSNVVVGNPGPGGGNTYTTQQIDLGPEAMQPIGMSGAAIYQLQQQMLQAGLLSGTDLQTEAGTWGEKSRIAYTELLREAYASGRFTKAADGSTSADALGQLKANLANFKGTSGGAGPKIIKLTSPDTIADIAQGVATKKLGRSLDPGELSNIVTHFQAAEKATQLAEQQAATQGGGTVTLPATPDASTIGADIQNTNPGEAGAQNVGNALQSFSNILGRNFGLAGVGTGAGTGFTGQ